MAVSGRVLQVGVVVDVAVVSKAVAELLAAGRVKELGEAFAEELAAAAQAGAGGVTQHIRADRDAYAAGQDQTVINYRRPGE
jgi:hypothetical protein